MCPAETYGAQGCILGWVRLDYVVKRIGSFVVCVWLAASVNFLLPRVQPGRGRGTANAAGEVWQHYLTYLSNCLRLDFGYSSSAYPTRVNDLIGAALPWTIALLVTASLTAWVLGCLLGAILAWPRAPLVVRLLGPPIMALQSIPYYLFGLILMFVFVFHLHWFPLTGGFTGGTFPGLRLDFALDILYHAVLPGLSIVLVAIGGWALLTRGLVVTTLHEDFMLFAEAKGLRGRTVFLRYALRNALLPQVTGLGLSLGQVVTGGVLVEQVFAYPGVGRLLTLSIRNSDYNLLGGVAFVIIVGVSLATLILDLIYPLLDPRVQAHA
jgi:peptide/nickel transport system permease protein